MSARKILLTGGSGFIGSHLRKTLQTREVEVALVARKGSGPDLLSNERLLPEDEIQRQDLRDYALIHLATLYRPTDHAEDLDALVEANLRFSLSVARRYRLAGGETVVVAGTWHQLLFRSFGRFPSSYAASKEAFDVASKAPAFRDGASWAQLLLYDVIGENDPRPKVAPLFAAAIREGQAIRIPKQDFRVDILHVSDVVEALLLAAAKRQSGDFTVHRGEPVTLEFLAQSVMTLMGRKVEIRRDYPMRNPDTKAPIYGERPHGWAPKLDLLDSLRRTIAPTRSEGAGPESAC